MRKRKSTIKIIIYTMAFIVVMSIPISYIEGKSFCLLYNLFSIKCFGCGTTRAIFNLLHLNLEKAINYNIFAVLWFTSFLLIIFQDILISLKVIFLKENKNVKFSFIEKACIWLQEFFKGSINIK